MLGTEEGQDMRWLHELFGDRAVVPQGDLSPVTSVLWNSLPLTVSGVGDSKKDRGKPFGKSEWKSTGTGDFGDAQPEARDGHRNTAPAVQEARAWAVDTVAEAQHFGPAHPWVGHGGSKRSTATLRLATSL